MFEKVYELGTFWKHSNSEQIIFTLWIVHFQYGLVKWAGKSTTGSILRIIYQHQVTPINWLNIHDKIAPRLNADSYIRRHRGVPYIAFIVRIFVAGIYSTKYCLLQLASVFKGAPESDISSRICNRKEPVLVTSHTVSTNLWKITIFQKLVN